MGHTEYISERNEAFSDPKVTQLCGRVKISSAEVIMGVEFEKLKNL